MTTLPTVSAPEAETLDYPIDRSRKGSLSRRAVATIALASLILLVTLPVAAFQIHRAQTAALQSDLATAATLLITSDYEGNRLPTTLPGGLTTQFPGVGSITPETTIDVVGAATDGTLCVQGATPVTNTVWSFDLEAGGLRETGCQTA